MSKYTVVLDPGINTTQSNSWSCCIVDNSTKTAIILNGQEKPVCINNIKRNLTELELIISALAGSYIYLPQNSTIQVAVSDKMCKLNYINRLRIQGDIMSPYNCTERLVNIKKHNVKFSKEQRHVVKADSVCSNINDFQIQKYNSYVNLHEPVWDTVKRILKCKTIRFLK